MANPRIIRCLALCCCLVSLNVGANEVAVDAVIAKRVIQLPASSFAGLDVRAVEDLSLMAWDGQALAPVPFQIDEIGEAGLVWFDESGLDARGENGVFDGADQLLVMFRDAGGVAPSSATPEEGRILSELRLKHPRQGADRFLYLVEGSSARSERRYVEHNLETGVTRTPWYRLDTDPENELNWLYLDYQGYQGKGSIIDTLKMRMAAGVFTRFARVTLDNDNLEPTLKGHKTGAIRSVMHLETRVVLAGIPVMRMHVQAYRYPRHYEAHTYANIPFIYRATLKEPRVSVSVDGNRQYGALVRTARGGELKANVDGKMSEEERRLIEKGLSTDENWILFETHRGFALLTLLDMPPALSGIPLGLVYEDDGEKEVAPERYKGQLPNVGYALEGWPPESELTFAVKMLFDDALPDMPPTRYAQLRTDEGDWVVTREWGAE